MNRLTASALLLVALVAGTLRSTALNQTAGESEEVTIYRDQFGVPHIFATTEEGVTFGMGYAQAEDRLEELLKQYRRCTGTMAETFGPSFVQHDYRQRLWQHQAVSEANYANLPAKVRSIA